MADSSLLGNLLVKIVGDRSDLEQKLNESEKQATDAGKKITGNLKKQLGEIDTALGGLGSKISKLLTNPLVLATTAVIAAGKAFADTTKALVDYGSEINDISERTGISTDAIQQYKFVAEQTGSSIETITNSVKLMTRGLDTNADAFQKLGVQTRDAAGNYRSASDIFDETIAALGGITNETEQTKLALEIFGRDAQNLVPILKLGAGGLEEMKEKARDLGLVMDEKTIKAADELGDTTEALAASWKAYTMSLVKDSLPALKELSESLLNIAKAKQLGDEYAQSFKDIKAYQAGKQSVLEYHASLLAMIEVDKKYSESTDKSMNAQLNKAAAIKELSELRKKLVELEASSEYRAAKAAEEKAAAEKSAMAVAAAAAQAETERLNELRAARDAATKEYQDSITKTRQLEAAGLRTTVQAQDEVTAATKKYAEALVPIVAASGSHLIGAQSLKQALIDLRTQGIEPVDAAQQNMAANGVALMQAAEAQSKAEAEAYIEESRKKREAMEAERKAEEESLLARKAVWLNFTNVVSSAVKSTFELIGQDLAANELSWQSLGTAAINSIGAIVSALGDELAAKAAKTLVEAIAASLNPLTMAAAPGLYAASAELGLGAAAAWTAGGALKAIKLANGGIASRPTPAIVGDNPWYDELVQPLSPEFYASLGDGILSALASRARGPGVTEATVAQARSVATGSSGGSGGVTLQVGTLVADDAGLRKLERTLRRFGLQEDVRVGG